MNLIIAWIYLPTINTFLLIFKCSPQGKKCSYFKKGNKKLLEEVLYPGMFFTLWPPC
jgi:hypothetical protein